MPYQIADGWNNTGGLADLVIQPASPGGLQIPQRVNADSGDAYHEGEMFMDLVYSLNEDRAALETQLGVSITVASNQVTIRLPDNNYTFANFNAWVEYPTGGQRFNRNAWNQVVYRVRIKESL